MIMTTAFVILYLSRKKENLINYKRCISEYSCLFELSSYRLAKLPKETSISLTARDTTKFDVKRNTRKGLVVDRKGGMSRIRQR